MLASQRKNYILKRLFKHQYVTVKLLANKLNVSFETIRRDLKDLEDQGFLIKNHGGGTLSEKISSNIPSNIRKDLYHDEKNLMAKRAIKLIENNMAIFLDSSTTSLAIANNLLYFENLTIFTNSFLVAQEVAKQNKHKLVLIGGNYDPLNESFVDDFTRDYIKNFLIDLAFISPTGISKDGLITDFNQAESLIRKQVLANSKQTFLVMDQTKFFRSSTFIINDINSFDGIVTNATLPKELKKLIIKSRFEIKDY